MADFKPAINLFGRLPDLNRSIQPVTQETGKDVYVQRAQMSNRLGLALEATSRLNWRKNYREVRSGTIGYIQLNRP